ncbi:basic proline-rich protein-like [Equus asinus]|uniref:basic proline-rich protein-like n=1 Tax=Equus asinus TaxID=9793 RepID=UPI0038F74438
MHDSGALAQGLPQDGTDQAQESLATLKACQPPATAPRTPARPRPDKQPAKPEARAGGDDKGPPASPGAGRAEGGNHRVARGLRGAKLRRRAGRGVTPRGRASPPAPTPERERPGPACGGWAGGGNPRTHSSARTQRAQGSTPGRDARGRAGTLLTHPPAAGARKGRRGRGGHGSGGHGGGGGDGPGTQRTQPPALLPLVRARTARPARGPPPAPPPGPAPLPAPAPPQPRPPPPAPPPDPPSAARLSPAHRHPPPASAPPPDPPPTARPAHRRRARPRPAARAEPAPPTTGGDPDSERSREGTGKRAGAGPTLLPKPGRLEPVDEPVTEKT